jgi:hypothetical protein
MTISDSLSGKKLRQKVHKNDYLTIDRFIASHPEFELIKNEAKKKVLSRVKKYKESQDGSKLELFSPL